MTENSAVVHKKTCQVGDIQKITLDMVREILQEWANAKKYGYVQVNFAGGNINTLNFYESVKLRVDPK